MLFIDTETCGLHGVAVLIQYALDDGPIKLWDIWKEPICETLELIEWICEQNVCGFNLAFDWFHLCKIYTMLSIFEDLNALPEDHIPRLAQLEEAARFGPCLKPKRACDLLLWARKGTYQSLMSRKDIVVKRVPAPLAYALANELEKRVEVDGIYFSRRSDKHMPQWQVFDIKDHPDFKNVVLKFAASGALKVLAEHVLKVKKDDILRFTDIEVNRKHWPKERGWAPFANGISNIKRGWRVFKDNKVCGYAWPKMVKYHISHWAHNTLARKYAGDDVKYTRDLYHHPTFHVDGKPPEPGDDDSELACMVAAVRWHGMSVNLGDSGIKGCKVEALARQGAAPIEPKRAMLYIGEMMDDIEKVKFTNTRKMSLQAIAETWKCDCTMVMTDSLRDMGFGDFEIEDGPCERCKGTKKHPASARAQDVIEARRAKKEIEVFDKILQAGRFHPSFRVIGALSSRMAGSDGLNAQGINRKKEVRGSFDFADEGFVLCGGDFDAFEVVLADAAYDDPALRAAITKVVPCICCDRTGKITKNGVTKNCGDCEGKGETAQKIHALFAMELFPGTTYDDIMASKGTDKDLYTIGKSGVFAMIYGGDWNTLVVKQGINPEVAQKAEKGFVSRFPGVKIARDKILDSFCSMRQPKGIGTQVVWADPAEYVESLFNFRRYFTLENRIAKALFELARDMPKSWKDIKIKVTRNIKQMKSQTISGATSSALYGAAFGIQGQNMRAAANHVIQSSGATITKYVQRKAWDLQPHGVKPWRLYGINVHDELMICAKPEYQDAVGDVVHEAVESFRPRVPLIKFEFQRNMSSWAAK